MWTFDHGWGWMWGGGLAMLLFWVLLIAGIVAAVRALSAGSRSSRTTIETAAEILARRYASGEIDREQYETMKKVLQS